MLTRKLYAIGRQPLRVAAAGALLAAGLHATSGLPQPAGRVEILQSVTGLPPHLVGQFGEAAAFQQDADGQYFVVDRRG